MIKKLLLISVLLISTVQFSFAASAVDINFFAVKENPFAQEQVAIVATDSLGNIQETVHGQYTFTINGFQQPLNFDNGTAFYRHKIERSTFMYVKHENEAGTHSALYYIYKHDMKLSPWHISWMWLLIIPVAILLAGYLFKRFIILAIIVLVIFFYFSHHNGLHISTFFESIFDGLKHLFH